MFAIEVRVPGQRPRRYTSATQLVLGRDPECDVVIDDDTVSPRHVKLLVGRRAQCVAVDVGSLTGTLLDGHRLDAPEIVRMGDTLELGRVQVYFDGIDDRTLAEHAALEIAIDDDVEYAFVRAIAAGDHDTRLVYADWLEERGDTDRASFLRMQEALHAMAPEHPEFRVRSAEFAALALTQGALWRARVGRRPIERCEAAFDFQCPKQWESLQQTTRDDVRHCTACERDVVLCTTVLEARRHAAAGDCVAIDALAVRWDNDLEAPYDRWCNDCSVEVGALERCPRCGERVYDDIMMGVMVPDI